MTTAAVLANPEAYAKAAYTTVKALGDRIGHVGMAIDALIK
jgi:hypothetical protein